MRKVLTYFVVVLLFCSLCLTLTPKNAQSKTADVKILSYTHYIDAIGFLGVAGEIQNTGTDTLEEVVLTGTAYGSDGTIQSTLSSRAWVSFMVPQQKAPFLIDLKSPQNYSDWTTAGISKITVSVSIAKESTSHLYSDFTTTVTSAGVSSNADDLGTYWISGTIQNTGSQAATKLAVAAIFYNSSGAVVAVGHSDYLTPDTVSPSAAVSFKVGAFDTNQSDANSRVKITSYTLNVQATTPLLQGSGSTSTSQPTGATQTDNQNLIYIAIIAVVAIAVLLLLRKSKRKPLPPPPKPIEPKKKQNKKR